MVHEAAARGFARSADAYDRARPDYPAPAIAWLRERLDLHPGRTVVDLAAGTGKLTRPLAATGATVVAIEPVAEMRARIGPAAERALDGTAEAMPLPDGSADAVTVGQAFHWFDGPAALAEIHRVLRPAARLVIEIMHRDRLVSMFRERDWTLLGEGRLLLEQRTFDPGSGVAQTTQTLIDRAGDRDSRTFSVRVYTATELVAMLLGAGFEEAKCYGDLDGGQLGTDTRLVIVARRGA
jgi:ubiquinone/menaquinone biosynthesis C-methylase UbiE